jgi:hypothetical protein
MITIMSIVYLQFPKTMTVPESGNRQIVFIFDGQFRRLTSMLMHSTLLWPISTVEIFGASVCYRF